MASQTNIESRAQRSRDVDWEPIFTEAPRTAFLNAFPITCSGAHQLRRFPRPETHEERRELEKRLGVRLWGSGRWLYAAAGDEGMSIGMRCAHDPELHAFVLREAFAAHAKTRGFERWFPFAGELRCSGLPGELRDRGLVGQRGLRLRVMPETAAGGALLVARHAKRWVLEGTLADAATQAVARGEIAIRLDGDGPARGEVCDVDASVLTLRTRDGEATAAPGDYTLSAAPSLVRRHLGQGAFRWMQVASGSLTESGRRNRFAIRDRMSALAEDLGAFGLEIALPDGGRACISPHPIEVRLQERR